MGVNWAAKTQALVAGNAGHSYPFFFLGEIQMLASRWVFFGALCLLLGVAGFGANHRKAGQNPEFSKPTIDVGIVVSDLEKSAQFYTAALGMSQSREFSVPADFAKESGLTDSLELNIKVFTLGDGPGATEIKLMQIEGAESAKVKHDYIHSSLGFSYLTLHITSTETALERLKKAQVQAIAQGPVAIGGTDLFLTIVRDPDGNMIELVGPK